MTGLLVGAGYGYGAQRGAFCMNSGFRDAVTKGNTTKVKAYVLAIALQMVLVPIVFAVGFSSATYPAFFPVGAVIGGLLFGASMRWAGGCAAGVWYKMGAGSWGAICAVAGMALGATLLELGPLAGVRELLQSFGPTMRFPVDLWVFAPAGGLIGTALLLHANDGVAGHWSWRRTGLWIGVLGALAWPLSSPAHCALLELGRLVRSRDSGRCVLGGSPRWPCARVEGKSNGRREALCRRFRSRRRLIARSRMHGWSRSHRGSASGSRKHRCCSRDFRRKRHHVALGGARCRTLGCVGLA